MNLVWCDTRTATRVWANGNCSPKFLKSCLVVTYNNMLQPLCLPTKIVQQQVAIIFPPPDIWAGCGPVWHQSLWTVKQNHRCFGICKILWQPVLSPIKLINCVLALLRLTFSTSASAGSSRNIFLSSLKNVFMLFSSFRPRFAKKIWLQHF